METLGREQLTQMKEAFLNFDEDKTGKLDNEQLKDFIKPLEIDKIDDKTIRDMMLVIDPDNDGHVDYVEFVMLMGEKIKDEHIEAELEKAYRHIARTLKNKIDEKLMYRIFKRAGETVEPEELERVFKALGVRNKEMTFQDFNRVMLHK